jgi:two-component system, cell cycle response regulator CpdR
MARILVVDDEEGIRTFLQILLKRAGHDVLAVASGREALSACRSDEFDVLLSDVTMPEIDGHELVRWVAAVSPYIKPILMSGDSRQCDDCPIASQCLVLRKPFLAGDVLAAIGAALDKLRP